MPVRTFAIGFAVLCFVLAGVPIFATISAARRRRIVALVIRGVLALGLLAIVAAQLPTIFWSDARAETILQAACSSLR